jgi:catalase
MRSFQCIAAGFAFAALMAAGATRADAEDESLGVRLVNQMNALYGRRSREPRQGRRV